MNMNNGTLKRWVKTYLQVFMLSFHVWKGPITFWIHETILQTIKVAAPLLVKYVIYLSWNSLTIPLHHEFLRVTSVEFTKSIFPQLTSSTAPHGWVHPYVRMEGEALPLPCSSRTGTMDPPQGQGFCWMVCCSSLWFANLRKQIHLKQCL